MKRLQFSLLWLLGVVVLVAVACAALRSASDIWGSAAFTLTVGVLFVALVGLIFRQREARVFWGGFALVGWGYLLLVFGPWFKDNVSPQLLTTKLLEYTHTKLQRPANTPLTVVQYLPAQSVNVWNAGSVTWPATTSAPVTSGNTDLDGDGVPDVIVTNTLPGWNSPATFTTTVGAIATPSPQQFIQVGHSLWALLLAGAAGILARYFHDRQARPMQGEPAGT